MTSPDKENPTQRYKLVFCGELRPGHDRYSVKAKLASHFQILEKEAEALFSGAPFMIMENAEHYRALEVAREFERIGAVCRILKAEEPPEVTPEPEIQARKRIRREMSPPAAQPPVQVTGTPGWTGQSPPRKGVGGTIAAVLGIALLAAVGFRLLTPGNRIKQTEGAPSPGIVSPGETGLLTPYIDPKGNYTIRIPRGYRLRDTSSGNRSKRSFVYHGGKVSLTLLASPMQRQWLPEAELMKRVEGIENGRAGVFSTYRVERYGLLEFNGLDGYEILMSKGKQTAHAYALVSSGNVAFSVAIVDMGGGSVDHDRLDEAVRQYLIPSR